MVNENLLKRHIYWVVLRYNFVHSSSVYGRPELPTISNRHTSINAFTFQQKIRHVYWNESLRKICRLNYVVLSNTFECSFLLSWKISKQYIELIWKKIRELFWLHLDLFCSDFSTIRIINDIVNTENPIYNELILKKDEKTILEPVFASLIKALGQTTLTNTFATKN